MSRRAYERAEAALHAFTRTAIDNTPPRAGHRLRAFLDARGAPDRRLQIVVVVGTVGKGSTATCLASILRACGETVGLFTGPHLARYTERAQVNGRAVSTKAWARQITDLLQVAEALPDRPSLLEVLAVAAVEWFVDRGVRWAVMEAGVGGHRDHTMAFAPVLSVLTRIDIDHADLLGDTIAAIAHEKCGAVRAGTSVVSGVQTADAAAVITARANEAGAPLWLGGRDVHVGGVVPLAAATRFDYSCALLGVDWQALRVPLAGAHQAENAALAVTAALRLWAHGRVLLSEGKVRRGLASARFPGRLEVLGGMPEVLLDGAHQPVGARALRVSLDTVYASRDVFLVLGVFTDKDRDGIAAALVGRAARTFVTLPPWADRAGDVAALEDWAARAAGRGRVEVAPTWEQALEAARDAAREAMGAGRSALVVVTGSLYLVGAARERLFCPHLRRMSAKGAAATYV